MGKKQLFKKINYGNIYETSRFYGKDREFLVIIFTDTKGKNHMFTTAISKDAQHALALLGKSKYLPPKTYLAGGSALAIHFGHRKSEDFDFFTPNGFDADKIIKSLKKIGVFTINTKEKNTLLGVFSNVKFSLFKYEYPVLFKTFILSDIAILDPKDIAAMKLAAIIDRGTKKDFIDIFFLVKNNISLDNSLKYYDQKYKALANNLYSLIKGLLYFADAEDSDMPEMIEKLSWEEVKEFFQKEVVKLAKKYL